MSDIDFDRVLQNIGELQDQNAIDFQQWKKLGQDIKVLESKIKSSDKNLNLLMKKIKYDYESLRKVIVDENVQIELKNAIDDKVSNKTFITSVNSINEQLDTIETYKTFKSVKEYGAVSDCLFYNATDNKYYKDSNYTTLATDNTIAFKNALNSGYNIIIDGDFFVNGNIDCNKKIKIISNNGNIYCESNDGDKGLKNILKFNNEITIEGVNFYSKNNKATEMHYRPENVQWVSTMGYSSNVIAIIINSDNCIIRDCNSCEIDYLCTHSDNGVIKNITIDNCNIDKSFIGLGFGNVKNLSITNCSITMEESLCIGTPHAIYFWGGCDNITINNCFMYNEANITSFIRTKRENGKIYINNTTFKSAYQKSILAVETITDSEQNIIIASCKVIDCRGLVANLGVGECSIISCELTSSNNLTDNPLTSKISIIENSGGAKINISNSRFEYDYHYSNVFKLQNCIVNNCSFKLNKVVEETVNTPLEIIGQTEIYNSSFIFGGRAYITGNGAVNMYNSVFIGNASGETSYLNSVANFYKCILSTLNTNYNSLALFKDCTTI